MDFEKRLALVKEVGEEILTEEELHAVRQVRETEKPIEDPTVLMILFHAVERLANKIQRMRDNDEDAAQTIKDYLTLQQSAAEIEQGHSTLNGIAEDLSFNEAP